MPRTKIVYPNFIALADETDDLFWKQRFDAYAKGNLPRSCQVKPGGETFLVWQTNRGKTSSYTSFDLSDQDKTKLLSEIIECFHKELDIYSPTEKEDQECRLELLLNPPKDTDLKPIKTRPMDKITRFVQKMGKSYGLKDTEEYGLYIILTLSVMNREILVEHFEEYDGNEKVKEKLENSQYLRQYCRNPRQHRSKTKL